MPEGDGWGEVVSSDTATTLHKILLIVLH